MLKKEYGFCTFYGRKFDGKKIVFLEIEGFDDYDSAIFQEFIDKEEVMIIDLHNQPKDVHENEMRYGTVEADKTRENLDDFLGELDKLPEASYKAGKKVDTGENSHIAIVEEVNDQRTLTYGLEGNDASKEMLELREELEERFDQVLFFTTDTHSSIHELASEEQLKKSEMLETVRKAEEDVSEASLGFSVSQAPEMNYLIDEYFGLIYSINILVRLVPLMLVFLYILLVVWLI